MRRRNDLDICADILEVAQYGAKKTEIVYQANLNFKIVKKYIERLIADGFLEVDGRFFRTTDRGIEFMKQYRILLAPINLQKVEEMAQ